MLQYLLKKEDLDKLIVSSKKDYKFIAPIRGAQGKRLQKSHFSEVEKASDIFLERKSYYPVKSFFFKPDEVIFEFKENRIQDPVLKLSPSIYFGLRKCDLNGIWHQDIVFLEENADPFYKARREASLLFGVHCLNGDDYCFCSSFNLRDFFDLMFYDKGRHYIVESGSRKGEEFARQYSKFFAKVEGQLSAQDKITINKRPRANLEIDQDFDRTEWLKGSDKCISCGACNLLCVNCHCFDLCDDIDSDLKRGKRVRRSASCQFRSFTRVAGEHIFRLSRNARFKHRIYHQIQYFKDRHNVVFCTGCGRCIEGCPAKIDWVNLINEMKR